MVFRDQRGNASTSTNSPTVSSAADWISIHVDTEGGKQIARPGGTHLERWGVGCGPGAYEGVDSGGQRAGRDAPDR